MGTEFQWGQILTCFLNQIVVNPDDANSNAAKLQMMAERSKRVNDCMHDYSELLDDLTHSRWHNRQ
jgi:hypothetical protein